MSDRDIRNAALAGMVGFAFILAAALITPPLWEFPTTSARPDEVASFAFPYRSRIIAAFFVYSIGMGFFLWFVAGLWSWFRRWETGSAVLSAVFAFGSITAATLILGAFAPGTLSVYRPPTAETAGLLFDLSFALLALSGVPTAVFMGAYAILVFRGAPLGRWTGWVAVVGALAHLVIAGSMFPRAGFFSLEGRVIIWVPATLIVWILVASVALFRRTSAGDGSGTYT